MGKVDNIASEIDNGTKKLASTMKAYIFDFIAIGLVVSIGLLGLGAIEVRDIVSEIWNIIFEAIPFYLGSVTLAVNYYKKGTFAAKATESFINTVKRYSAAVCTLTGEQIAKLNNFCSEYNARALRLRQENILRDVAIPFEMFDEGFTDSDGHHKPLKTLSDKELIALYGDVIGKALIRAKKVKIKGVSPSSLLSNIHTDDITDIGKNEQELLKYRTNQYSIVYFASILVMSLMGIRDVLEWGWMGMFLVIFKLLYILCRSYMKYFEGFDDINIHLVNHISRKFDILKEFDCWYENQNKVLQNADVDSNISYKISYNK